MTLTEYYGFPEGTISNLRYASFYDDKDEDFPCPSDMTYAFGYETSRVILKKINTSNVLDMKNMFYGCDNLITISQLDTSNVTNMENLFYGCDNLITIPQIDTSNVTNIKNMFYVCGNLITIPQLDTSNVTDMSNMFRDCKKLTTIPPLYAGNLTASFTTYNGLFSSSDMESLVNFGGLIDLKLSFVSNYGLNKCPNLSYESCINVLNGLYDFTGNGETPTSKQGQLKVHANFLTTVGDEISIGTDKGWTITT